MFLSSLLTFLTPYFRKIFLTFVAVVNVQVKMPKRPKKKAMETGPSSPHQGVSVEGEEASTSEVGSSCYKVRYFGGP